MQVSLSKKIRRRNIMKMNQSLNEFLLLKKAIINGETIRCHFTKVKSIWGPFRLKSLDKLISQISESIIHKQLKGENS